MRLLHTSDWHLGRRLHGADLGPAQQAFLDHLVATVRAERIDVVLLSGDVHDRSQPPVECLRLLSETLVRLRDAGAVTVMISGNHDAAGRLGDRAELLDRSVHVRTDPARIAEPVVLEDGDGPVAIYALPYLEPAASGHLVPGSADGEQRPAAAAPLAVAGAHQRVLAAALRAVHRDRQARGGRSVALAHAWVTGGEASASERDITVGGLAHVTGSLFDGLDYAALGHLHRPQALAEHLRYAGSPLAYSFGESAHPKSSWLVELGPSGLTRVEAVPVPLTRALSQLRGELADLLTDARHSDAEQHYVSATLTDAVRPVEAMAMLQRRFPYAVTLEWCPPAASGDGLTYRERTRGRSELEVAGSFVEHVRSPAGEDEQALLAAALEAARAAEAAA